MKIGIVGPGECGKDTVCNWFESHTTLIFAPSTSMIIAPHVAKKLEISLEEAIAKRRENRELWYNIGRDLCKDDEGYLVKECLKYGDLIQGMRAKEELDASRKLLDLIIWIQRSNASFDKTVKFRPWDCDILIHNNHGFDELYEKLERLSKSLGIFK